MKFLTCFILACAGLSLVLSDQKVEANDSAVDGMGGSWKPVKGESPSIQMKRETVQIDIYRDHYDVKADFKFVNSGSATTVKMGFPEEAYPSDTPKQPSFIKFQTSVDGKKTEVHRVVTNVNQMGTDSTGKPVIMGFSALWVKDVPFASKQSRKVNVSYRSPFGDAAIEGANFFVPYMFTGGNWKGVVEESLLSVTLHEPASYIIYVDAPGSPKTKINGPNFSYRWTNWQAQGSFAFWFARTLKDWLIFPGGLQVYNAINLSDSAILSRTYEVTVPGKATAPRQWMPPILKRNGILYANLDTLRNQIERQSKQNSRVYPINSFTTQDTAGLRMGDLALSFWTDQAKFALNSGGSIDLPTPPFSYPPQGPRYPVDFYVPLEPVIKALGGNVWVNESKRRAYFEIPALEASSE